MYIELSLFVFLVFIFYYSFYIRANRNGKLPPGPYFMPLCRLFLHTVELRISYVLIKIAKTYDYFTKLISGPWGIPYFGYLPFMGKVPCETVAKLSQRYGPLMTLQMGQYP